MMFDSPGGLAHGENSDDKFRYRHKRKKIAKVDQLTAAHYNPRGATPLNDAIIHGIETVAAEEDSTTVMPATVRPILATSSGCAMTCCARSLSQSLTM